MIRPTSSNTFASSASVSPRRAALLTRAAQVISGFFRAAPVGVRKTLILRRSVASRTRVINRRASSESRMAVDDAISMPIRRDSSA
jgi:hypothetical protein